jgi:hypothetical protein
VLALARAAHAGCCSPLHVVCGSDVGQAMLDNSGSLNCCLHMYYKWLQAHIRLPCFMNTNTTAAPWCRWLPQDGG